MTLTENRRIILNTAATYGRSLVSLCFGLWTSRWVLQALGKDDFGLYGVVGGLIAFVVLLNNVMANSVGRFYAYAVGEARNMSQAEGRDHVSRWFNTALTIHGLLPALLIAIGYPVGVYAIRHWLVIPPDRFETCIWVFRFSLITAFVNMISVPYIAMYRARQLIVELSVWGMVQTVFMFCIAYTLLSVEGDRMFVYAGLVTMLSCLVLLLQMIRARMRFPECAIHASYMLKRKYLKPLLGFGFWEIFSCFGDICRQHGTAFLINRRFDSGVNAAYGIAMQVSVQTSALSQALLGALSPAVTSSAGAGNQERAISLGLKSSKFSAFLVALFAVPLIIEMDEVLRLWLVTPPEWTAAICRAILIALICHKLGWGNHMLVMASGNIAGLECCLAITSLLTLPLIWVLIQCGTGVPGIGYAFIASYFMLSVLRAFFSWRIVGLSPLRWLKRAVLPVSLVVLLMFVSGLAISRSMPASFARVVSTSFVCLIVALVSGWFLLFSASDHQRMLGVIGKSLNGLMRR